MALSVEGGGLQFVASIDTTNFKAELDSIEAKLKANFDAEVQRDLLRQKAQTEYVQTISESANAFAALGDNVKIQIADLIELRSELAKVKDAQATVSNGVGTGQIDSNEGTALLAGLFVREKQLEAAINETSSAINKQIASATQGFDAFGNAIVKPIGLIEALKEKLSLLGQALNSAQTPEAIASLNAEIVTTQAELTKLSNIGKEGFDALGNEIKGSVGLIGQLKEQALQLHDALLTASTPQEISALNKQLEGVAIQLNNLKNSGTAGFDELGNKINEAVEPAQRISARIREITNELVGLEKGTPEFNALIREAAELTDELGDVRSQIKLLSSDTAGLDAGIETVQGLAGVFAAAQGAMALFGDENKDLQKSLLQVNAAMSIMQGLQQVGNLLDKNSALNRFLLLSLSKEQVVATEAQALATEGLAVAEGEAAVATEGLTAAMEANPAGVILLAISALFIAYQGLASGMKDVEEQQKAVNDAMAEAGNVLKSLLDSYNQLNKARTQEADDAVKLAQTQGKSTDDILKLQLKVTEARKFEQIAALATLGYDKQRVAEGNAQLESILKQQHGLLELKASLGELSKYDQQHLESLQAQEKALRSTLDPANAANEAIKATDQEAANLRATQAKKAHDDALKSAQAEADTRLLIAEKNSADELAARIADIKQAAKVELDNVNLTAGERKKILAKEQSDIEDAQRAFNIVQLNNDKSLLNARLAQAEAGSAKELSLRIDLLNKAAEIEEAADGVSAQRKAEIQAKLAKDISDLTRKYAFDNQKQDLDIQSANISARLSAAQKGSEQELALNKQLIDAKAAQDILAAQDQLGKSEATAKLLVAKIKEINAKARADEKKADDEYYNARLQEQIKGIDDATGLQRIPLQAVQNDPFATYRQKFDAQKQIVNNDIAAIQQEINLVGNSIIKNQGDERTLKAQLDALTLKKAQLQSDLAGLNNTGTVNNLKSFADYAGAASTAFHDIGDAVSGFNADLGKSISIMGDLASQAASIATAFATGDPLKEAGAVIGAAGTVAKLIGSAFSNADAVAYQKQISDFNRGIFLGELQINELYRERALEQIRINQLRQDGITAEAEALRLNKDQLLKEYDEVLAAIRKTRFNDLREANPLSPGLDQVQVLIGNRDFAQIEALAQQGQLTDEAKKYYDELVRINGLLKDNAAELQANAEKAAGTTADNIVNSIADGFSQGFKSVQQFAGKTEDIIRGAMLNALKYQFLAKPIQALFDQFAKDAESGGGLDTTEVANFTANINKTIADAAAFTAQIEKATGISLSNATAANADGSANTLSGAIKSMSQQSADLLAGQFGGLRFTAIEQLDVMNKQLIIQNKIEQNTAGMWAEMATTYRSWSVNGLLVKIA